MRDDFSCFGYEVAIPIDCCVGCGHKKARQSKQTNRNFIREEKLKMKQKKISSPERWGRLVGREELKQQTVKYCCFWLLLFVSFLLLLIAFICFVFVAFDCFYSLFFLVVLPLQQLHCGLPWWYNEREHQISSKYVIKSEYLWSDTLTKPNVG